MAIPELRVIGLPGLPEIAAGDDLAALVATAVRRAGLAVESGDVLVVAQKAVSKAEGRVVRLAEVTPSALARRWGEENGQDPRIVEVVLGEAARIVRMERGVLIAETRHGFVCARAGVDASNVEDGMVTLLPEDPDASARRLREGLGRVLGTAPAVVISDTFGRPWREGQVNVAIGVAGLRPLLDHRGRPDGRGRTLHSTVIAVADELASAAELVMGKADHIPVALIKGAPHTSGEGYARELVRPLERNLFP